MNGSVVLTTLCQARFALYFLFWVLYHHIISMHIECQRMVKIRLIVPEQMILTRIMQWSLFWPGAGSKNQNRLRQQWYVFSFFRHYLVGGQTMSKKRSSFVLPEASPIRWMDNCVNRVGGTVSIKQHMKILARNAVGILAHP